MAGLLKLICDSSISRQHLVEAVNDSEHCLDRLDDPPVRLYSQGYRELRNFYLLMDLRLRRQHTFSLQPNANAAWLLLGPTYLINRTWLRQ